MYTFSQAPGTANPGPDGGQPFGDLTISGSTLYGETSVGGANGLGTIFALAGTAASAITNKVNGTFVETGNGTFNWSTATWSTESWNAIPPGQNALDTAAFGTIPGVGGTTTVNMDSDTSLSSLSFSNGSSFLIAGTNTLTMSNGAAAATITNNAGNHGVGVPIAMSNGLVITSSAGSTLAISGSISGSGGMTKQGTGELVLSGGNTYSGGTTVGGGTLKVANSAGSATGSGPVTIGAGATLSGAGIIGGPLEIAGALGPGDSPEILTVNNQVTFDPGSTFNAEVAGLTAGSGYDQLTTTGPVSLAGSLNLIFGTFTPTDHDILFLINNTGSGATTGTFQYADKSEIGAFDGFQWFITYEANDAATPSLTGATTWPFTASCPSRRRLPSSASPPLGCSAGRGGERRQPDGPFRRVSRQRAP